MICCLTRSGVFICFAIILTDCLAACTASSNAACDDAFSQMCIKACSCSPSCEVDLGAGPTSYGSSAQECETMAPCDENGNAGFSASQCTAAVAESTCTKADAGGATYLPVPACSFEQP